MSAEAAPTATPNATGIPADEQPTEVMDAVVPPGEQPTQVMDAVDPAGEQPTQVMDPITPSEDEQPTQVMDPVVPEDEQPTQVIDPVVNGGNEPSPEEGADEQATQVMPGPGEPADEGRPPSDQDELARSLQIKVVDTSEGVVAKANDYAEAHLAEQTTQRGFRGFLKRIWHGNLARDFIRLRKSQQGREEITETGNLYALEEGSQAEHDQEMAAVVTRFTDGYLHDGEREDQLSDTESGAGLEAELRTLVNFYAQGSIDADVLTEEKNRVLEQYKEVLHGEDRNKGLLLADNVVEVARNARAALAHGIAMERIQEALTASVGEARVGQRTEAKRELTDKIVDKLYSSKAGSLVNESTLALAAGIGMTAAKVSTRKALTAAAATVSMGLGAGVIAGLREHARVGHERQLHLRQRAAGQEAPGDGDTRRGQMEETRYDTVAADELTDNLAAAREAVAAAEPDSIDAALQAISEAEARIRLSDEEAVDLIDFSSTRTLEQERLKLDIALAEAKVAAGRALQGADEAALAGRGLGRDLDAVLEARMEGVHDLLRGDMSAKDSAFSKLRRNRTVKMAAAGLVTGLAIGEVVQEAHALVDDHLKGIFEPGDHHTDNRTLLAGMFATHGSDGSYHAGVHEAVLGKHAALELPKNFHIEKTGGGHYSLIDPQGKAVAENLALDKSGHLTPDSMDALQHSGLHMGEQQVQHYEAKSIVHHTIHRSAQEFLDRHPSDFTHVNRQLWYDNNTPGVFDKNELKMDWGADGAGVDANGNYVFNVSEMLPDGSYHDGFSANAQQLFHDGKMAVALSMTRGTQDHVVMIPIDAHGNAVIKADSWMAKSMFENHDGHASFTGAYAEAVQLLGKHHGTEAMRPLATVVGSGQMHEVTDTITRVVSHPEERIVTHLIHGHHRVEIPTPLPIYGRRGLESPASEEILPAYVGGYIEDGYRAGEGLMPREGLAPFSPELEADPDAKVDAKGSTRRYLRSLRPGYKRTVDKLAGDLQKERRAGDPKIVVMIPAAAHQEGRNIRNTLEQYAKQEDMSRDEFEVVVFANYPRGAKRDQTIREVRKFQRENPDVNVRLIQKRLEGNEANIGWIRKAVTDTVITDLSERGVDLDDVMLVSNDADSEWINPKYLRTIRDKAEASPDTDGFLGFIDWGHDAYKAHPEMLASTRFMQMLEIYMRVARHEIGSSGANFAFRPGIYTAVGGYSQGTSLGEDVVLGRMIKSVRAGAETRRPIAFMGRSSEVNTSARRALDKLLKDGGAPAAQWDDQFGANDELRNRDFDLRDFNFGDEAAVRRMVTTTQNMLNQTLNIYSSSLRTQEPSPSYRQGRLTLYDNETVRQINRMCFFLGLQVHWRADGTIKIDDASKMIDGLKDWQARH